MRRTLIALIMALCAAAPAGAAPARLVGGNPVPATAHPAVVLIQAPDIFGDLTECTGALVAKRVVVASVTCVFFLDLDNARVIVGRTSRTAGNGRAIDVIGFDVPPDLDLGPPATADVARLRLAADAPARPAPPAPPGSVKPATSGTLVSWGSINADGAQPDTPRALAMTSVDDSTCSGAWGRTLDTFETFCAVAASPGAGACFDDSGAPLLVSTPQGERLLGLVSSTTGCPDATLPTLFSRLTDPPLSTFISDPDAAAPPIQFRETSVHGQPWVGGNVRCDPGDWDSPSPVHFSFFWFRDNDQVLGATKSRRKLTIADRGAQVTCVVVAENAAGASFGVAGFPTVAAGPPVSDARPPRILRLKARCSGRSCLLTVRATDRSGIRRVEVGVRSGTSLRLLRMTRRGRFFRLALPRRDAELLVIATDRNGNDSKATRRTLFGDGTLTQPRARRPRIIDGDPASAATYPFVGALVTRDVDARFGQSCTGALIAPTVFLTAAHCVVDTRPADWDVLLGATRLSGGGQRIPVASISWDPVFTPERLGADVALVRLARAPHAPVRTVGLIDPAHAGAEAPGSPGRLLGWGITRLDDDLAVLPDDLRTAVLAIRADPACGATAGFPFTGATMLCADASPSGQTLCFGDSGGPLLVDGGGGNLLVAGVASWGLSCGSRISPSVFADVLQLRSWLGSSPPAAPERVGSVYISGNPSVRRTIHCVPQVRGTGIRTTFTWLRAGTRIGTGPSYRVKRGDAGSAISCVATSRNRGGNVTTSSQAVTISADLRGDHRRPTLSRPDIRCTQRLGSTVVCTIRVRAADRNGIADVAFLVAADEKPLRFVHGASENGEEWQAHLPTARHYQVVARAVDEAGNITRAARSANAALG
jgi:secreted trypsin-like serine protease